MEEYFQAKRVLFEGCGTDPPRAAVTNLDDEYGAKLVDFSRKRSSAVLLTYGWTAGDFHAEKSTSLRAARASIWSRPKGRSPSFLR